MELSINGGRATPVNSDAELSGALVKWGTDVGDFIILQGGDDDFIQSTSDDQGYIVEVRDGATAAMYRAVRRMLRPDQRRDRWTRDEALALIHAYFPLKVRSGLADWEDMHMRTVSKSAGAKIDWSVRVFAVLVLAAIAAYTLLVKR